MSALSIGSGAQYLKAILPHELSIEESGNEDSEDDEDRFAVVQDELIDSGEEYAPHDSSEEDSWRTDSDTYYDLTETPDDEHDLSDLSAAVWESIGDESSPEGNLKDAEEEEEEELVSPLTI
ncbi:hypothetical protein PMIN04_012682 [Paraphaeosphaeria minitans]|uniref:Uncharacterized protein n=1 Tax=Paraphaeosphaeria minitans TaxID=565426 RepID=A0A9P6G618_9PLEO|nr:hypothetical protein PMIN01_13338 [Paraphaeosphaeria minitans]KAF9730114.1 hypothetical protein PMIN01_12047 [Paraphaeosphaeria minitans]